MDSTFVHPQWNALLLWLTTHGMVGDSFAVESRSSPGAGYGLFATKTIEPSTPLFSIPAGALLNALTLGLHYPPSKPRLSCTQIVSLHLLLHRPLNNQSDSDDPLFGPYISVLPREFDLHPLTWLWKEDNHGPAAVALETQLLNALPASILAKLNKIFGLFKGDWMRIQGYLQENPSIGMRCSHKASSVITHWEEDYLWAWLNVNTRSIYHRLAKARSNPDNMTLCPVLDFANHTYTNSSAYPRPTQAEIWNSRPSSKYKYGENFVLLSPSTVTILSGEEIFLAYGMHSNSTLFAEYGFVNVVDWSNLPENFSAEVDMDNYVEPLFEQKGEVGLWMKNILQEEGYWGDWSMQISPQPAHPSYRLITALRLLCIVPAATNNLPITERGRLLDEWRNTTLGNQDAISSENERQWNDCLLRICKVVVAKAKEGLSKIAKLQMYGDFSVNWLLPMSYVEMLWREEIHVAGQVIASLEENIDF